MAGFDKAFARLQIAPADTDASPAKVTRCLANIDDKEKHRCTRKGTLDLTRVYTAKSLEERVMDCLCGTHKYYLERQAGIILWRYQQFVDPNADIKKHIQSCQATPASPGFTKPTNTHGVSAKVALPSSRQSFSTKPTIPSFIARSGSPLNTYNPHVHGTTPLASLQTPPASPQLPRTTTFKVDMPTPAPSPGPSRKNPTSPFQPAAPLHPQATKAQPCPLPKIREKPAPPAMPTTDLQGTLLLTFRIYSNVAKAFWLAKGREEAAGGHARGNKGKGKEGSISQVCWVLCLPHSEPRLTLVQEEEELRNIKMQLEYLIGIQDEFVAESRLQI
ncbi:MAG: hypothetical protein Q9180_002325 [Flavoplaca navasiana]